MKTQIEERKEQLAENIAQGGNAQQILSNELFKLAFTQRKAELFRVFCDSKSDQQDIRDEAWRTMQNLNLLEQYFVKYSNY